MRLQTAANALSRDIQKAIATLPQNMRISDEKLVTGDGGKRSIAQSIMNSLNKQIHASAGLPTADVSIYKVPARLREIRPDAYTPA